MNITVKVSATIHVHHVDSAALQIIIDKLNILTNMEKQEMADLTQLQAAVEANTEVEESAITLIGGLADQIEALKTDPIALQALADKLNAEKERLAAAVSANTTG